MNPKRRGASSVQSGRGRKNSYKVRTGFAESFHWNHASIDLLPRLPHAIVCMREPLFPIGVWAYHNRTISLLTFCQSVDEAVEYAKHLPFTPIVLSSMADLPFKAEHISEGVFGDALLAG